MTFFWNIIFLLAAGSAHAFDQTHKAWTDVLAQYQDAKGYVCYNRLKQDVSSSAAHSFSSYIESLQKVSLSEFKKWNDNERKAFLINAYNALTVKLILDHYPVPSIKKIGGFFTKPWSVKFFKLLDGSIESIDPIEHDWLRPKFKDYRIHAAVNCASVSCPPLRHEAFVAPKLDAQLDDQMKVWIHDTSRNVVNVRSKQFKLSKIFDWYSKDFESWGGGPVKVIARYTREPISDTVKKEIKISYLDYDWNLNECAP